MKSTARTLGISPVTFTVPTMHGNAEGQRGESDLNGGYHWDLNHPWGSAPFAGTRIQAHSELIRLVRENEKAEKRVRQIPTGRRDIEATTIDARDGVSDYELNQIPYPDLCTLQEANFILGICNYSPIIGKWFTILPRDRAHRAYHDSPLYATSRWMDFENAQRQRDNARSAPREVWTHNPDFNLQAAPDEMEAIWTYGIEGDAARGFVMPDMDADGHWTGFYVGWARASTPSGYAQIGPARNSIESAKADVDELI